MKYARRFLLGSYELKDNEIKATYMLTIINYRLESRFFGPKAEETISVLYD